MRTISRVIILFTLSVTGVLLLTSCGSKTLKGDLTEYSDPGRSFTISVPASDEDFWEINTETPDDTLDMTDRSGSINIIVQAMSKSKAEHIASDLSGFRDYIMANALSGIASEMKLSDENISVPDFITESTAQSFKMSRVGTDIKGDLVFMESEKCYYMFMITAVDKVYSSNSKVFAECILSLQEK